MTLSGHCCSAEGADATWHDADHADGAEGIPREIAEGMREIAEDMREIAEGMRSARDGRVYLLERPREGGCGDRGGGK